MNNYKVDSSITSNDIYKSNNIGKEFISIDMVKANFSSLVKYAEDTNSEFNSMAKNKFSYEEFMSRFTDIEYFIKSKYIRQVIFGACNPKRQITYEKYIMSKVFKKLLENLVEIILEKDIVSFSNDEIVIEVSNTIRDNMEKIEKTMILLGEIIPLHFEYFKLGKVSNSEAYVKEIITDKTYTEEGEKREENNKIDNTKQYKIKKANPIDHVLISRILKNQHIIENDLVFIMRVG